MTSERNFCKAAATVELELLLFELDESSDELLVSDDEDELDDELDVAAVAVLEVAVDVPVSEACAWWA
jgi:hypothetical protein